MDPVRPNSHKIVPTENVDLKALEVNAFKTLDKFKSLAATLRDTILDQRMSYAAKSHKFREIKIKCEESLKEIEKNISQLTPLIEQNQNSLSQNTQVISIISIEALDLSDSLNENPHDETLNLDKVKEEIHPTSDSKKDQEISSKSQEEFIVEDSTDSAQRLLKSLEEIKPSIEQFIGSIPNLENLSLTNRVKELAFRIFYDKRTLPIEIDEKLAGSNPQQSLNKIVSELELEDSNGHKIFEDVFGKKTYEECFQSLENLKYTSILVEDYKKEIDPLIKEDILEQIKDRFTQLEIGQSLLFQGGYSNKDDGHSVVYEFKRKDENSFELSIFNTGEGRPKMGPKILKYDVPLITMEDKAFLKGLIDFKIAPQAIEKSSSSSSRSMQNVYQYLSEKLGVGRYEASIPAQTWGNCAFMTLKAWIYSKISIKAYEQYHKITRENAAKELGELLGELSHEVKNNVFGQSLISHLDKKVSVIKNESTGLIGRISKLFYAIQIMISNWWKQQIF